MVKYKLIALSDLHLGHESCLLRNSESAKGLNEAVKAFIGGNLDGPEISEVETLVLNGDFIDAALSKANQMSEAAGNFFRELTSNIKISKIVMIPGNHDRILLKDAMDIFQNAGETLQYNDGVFPIEGIDVDSFQSLFNLQIDYYQNLSLLQLYGFKNEQEQLNIRNNTKIYFANPIYYEKIGEKSLIFNHGFHIFPDYFSLIRNSQTLEELENNTIKIITLIWNNRADQNITLQKSLWTGVQFLQSRLLQFRKFPELEYKPWVLLKAKNPKWIWRLNFFRNIIGHPKLEFVRKLWDIFRKIPGKELSKDNILFIYGHIHIAEIKKYYVDREIGTMFSYNTGAWCSWHKKLSPDSCVFTIDENGIPKLWKYNYPKEIVQELALF
ncbi:MAG: metallophosphoesterase [Candidatus Helarchaeota archaeon]